MKRIIMDLDNTISLNTSGEYASAVPNERVIATMREYHRKGFEIVIFSARNMRTYEGNVGKINLNTVPVILDWLNQHDVPCDELLVGKPWCGHDGFYVDDKAIRPDEFVNLAYAEICKLVGN